MAVELLHYSRMLPCTCFPELHKIRISLQLVIYQHPTIKAELINIWNYSILLGIAIKSTETSAF